MRVVPVLLLSVSAAACASGASSAETSPAPSAASSTTAAAPAGTLGRTLVASLQPVNTSGNRIIGTAKLTPTGTNEYRAELQIRNGGGTQNKFPWVIRPGGCGDDSRDVLGNELAYRVLETTADGTARINSSLKVQIPDGLNHINILKGPGSADREVVVSCGLLSPT
jgi:hypothetical protein